MAAKSVAVAILILAHTNLPQVRRLVAHLESDFDVFVHVDKRCAIRVSDFHGFARARVLKKIKATWGGLGLVRSTLELLKLASTTADYDRFVIISGQDVPLQTNNQIEAFFSHHSDIDFVDSQPFTGLNDSRLTRITRFHFFPRRTFSALVTSGATEFSRLLDRFIFLAGIRRSRNYDFRWGSQWMDLRSDTVEKILELVRTDSHFLRRFRFTFCPDEVFFQTAIEHCGDEAASTRAPHRFIDWHTGPEHPRVLRTADLERLEQTDALFARKCDSSIDPNLIENLYARLTSVR